MAKGTVTFGRDQKGFGVIRLDDGDRDVFVHISEVERAGLAGLVEGQKVTFEIQGRRRSGKSAADNLRVHVPEEPLAEGAVRFEELDMQLEASIEVMIAAADHAIDKIDRAIHKIAMQRESIAKSRSKSIIDGS
jgi:CspA family cold shock protein